MIRGTSHARGSDTVRDINVLATPENAALPEETCRRILEAVEPMKIILIGSHAYGTPSEDSDVDLLVVADTGGRRHQVRPIEFRWQMF